MNLRDIQEVILTKGRKRDIWVDPRERFSSRLAAQMEATTVGEGGSLRITYRLPGDTRPPEMAHKTCMCACMCVHACMLGENGPYILPRC